MGNYVRDYVKSPLNYIGGKYKLLPQILPLFPENIRCFVDLFTGGCNVGVNIHAENIICNDNLTYLIDLYEIFQKTSVEKVLEHVESRIKQYSLSLTNQEGYLQLRNEYNSTRNPLDLFVLTAYSFNHQIRFNNNHQYNNPFGRQRSSFNENMRKNLIRFVEKLHDLSIRFTRCDFTQFDCAQLGKNDFIYCDPPYLITTGTYNDGKRGFNGWGERDERNLLELLTNLDAKGVKFALSNVLYHKGKVNMILENWITENNYNISELNMSYFNSNYQTKDRNPSASQEILVTNYVPENYQHILCIAETQYA